MKKILNNFKKANAIVTVSKYWKNFFSGKKDVDVKNVYIIYNTFDIDKFNFSDEEISEFKKIKLLEKPIIYIGNCQKKKGVAKSYKKLKDLNAYLITSGKPQ
ncbi:MAG: hypothetical protein PHO28_03775 [Candidatus Pacebacteria bacterium]|nr:hypothetical protein [Candidatus Paceibacterota bacterium]